ncbi:MAG TPA: phytoene desaturase [Vicinamibacterales bacterium]|nr:phytoene desaturase [Vicinamibacterales bacterium]
MTSSPRRVAVIGSGFGGLALAIRLQAAGLQTILVEQRDKPGGRAYVYEDQGFTFDAGPTVITAPGCLEELFALANERMADHVDLLPVFPFYRLFWEDGHVFDYSNDLAAITRQIAARSPADVDGYDRFLAYATRVFDEGYTKLAHVPFLDIWSMVRAAPQLVRLEAYRTVYDVVAKYIQDDHLRQAFSFHSLLVGGNPFATSSIYTLIHVLERTWGVTFPRGGTGALVRALVALFERLGGTVRLNTPVERILTRDGAVTGIRTRGGEDIAVDAVASNADVVHTYKALLGHDPRGASAARALEKKRFSMSLFLIYFGTRRRHPHLAHHNVIFGPRYRELLGDIFDRGVLADDFSLYLHAPTVSDPALAPAGCEAFYVLSPVPHLGKGDIDWTTEGPRYADRILDYLGRHYIPHLREDLVTQRIFTPLDFETTLNAHVGSAFSLEPVLTQSAWFRVHNRDDRLKGLYFVGAGTHPGAGVPGVVNSAKATAGLMIADLAPAHRGA